MEYTINKIIKTAPANYGKTRVAFKVNEEPDKILSGFFTGTPVEGSKIEGEIVQKGEWWNFEFPKKEGSFSKTPPAGDYNRVERKIDAVLTEMQMLRGDIKDVLGDILSKLNKEETFP